MSESIEIDWLSIEGEYRAGVRSLRDIGGQYGITEAAIRKRAKRDDWVRDLSAKIKAKAEELVRTAEVRNLVRKEHNANHEKDIVTANAQIQADITLSHRSDIRRHKQLRDRLLDECIGQTEEAGEYERLAEILESGDMDKMHAAFRKATSLPQRIDGFKKLVESTKALVGLEREAFGLADNSNGDASQDSAKDWYSKTNGNVIGVKA